MLMVWYDDVGPVLSSVVCFKWLSKFHKSYWVLGVEKDASPRQIQKAFHKLSLQYHPDKNKNKGAYEKFAEINNGTALMRNATDTMKESRVPDILNLVKEDVDHIFFGCDFSAAVWSWSQDWSGLLHSSLTNMSDLCSFA
ncbi:hypothetical protein L1987_86186 [Smallanthus sonchifolius]|uniref:Uncharacterized protein n=1 Tax=Smallanthus sonchifolius TaxID=185202 RepID=A0ACB8XYJ9_9ASTR|nr:hypothetical protein L1987_86186 [Smallanthus sonchifolius]